MEHKLIRGGDIWLPFARSRLKALKATGLAHAAQQFVMPDGATVRVRITPGHDFIELAGGEAGYQFFTTGPAVQTQDGAYRGHALKVKAVPDKDTPGQHKLQAKAIASTLAADAPTPDRPARWRYIALAEDMARAFPRKSVWQRQGVPEHQYYAKDATDKHPAGVAPYPMLVNSWSQASPLAGLGERGSCIKSPPTAIDGQYDLAPSLFRKGAASASAGPMTDAPDTTVYGALAPDADWYKRAAFVTVTHPDYGARTFSVLTDISNQFHVYPANADMSLGLLTESELQWPAHAASIKTAIPDQFVQRADAPLPAWCRTDPEQARTTYERAVDEGDAEWVNEYMVRKPQYRWAFSSDCTKACAVVFEDLASPPLGDPGHTVPERGDGRKVMESLPGLVELGLHIALTGPEPEDFTFSLSLDRELQATVTKEYVMAADYAWVVKDGDTRTTELDDLIVLTGAIYHTSSERQTVPSANNVDLDLNALKAVVTVRNHTQSTDLREFLVSDTNLPYAGVRETANFNPQFRWALPYYEALGVLIAYDLRILAFVVQQRLIVQDLSGGEGAGLNARRQGVYRAVQRMRVYAHNALTQETLMDPASPLNAQLAGVFDNTAADTLFRFPVDGVGEYRRGMNPAPGEGTPGQADHLHTAYRSLDLMRQRFDQRNSALYWYGPLNVQFALYGGSVNAGAFLYYTKLANALRVGGFEAFSVHPDGSWSIATAPIYYYGGAGTDLAAKYPWVLTASQDEQIDPALMKQTMVDLISLRVTAKDGTARDVRGTHLACINEAFGTAWTEQDFLCGFALKEVQIPRTPVPDTLRYLTAASQTPGADDVFMVYRSFDHPEGTDVLGAGNPVYLDPRATDSVHEYATTGPVLRGASLFF